MKVQQPSVTIRSFSTILGFEVSAPDAFVVQILKDDGTLETVSVNSTHQSAVSAAWQAMAQHGYCLVDDRTRVIVRKSLALRFKNWWVRTLRPALAKQFSFA